MNKEGESVHGMEDLRPNLLWWAWAWPSTLDPPYVLNTDVSPLYH